MTGSRAHLGDSHNFARRVSMRAGRVAKPRTLLWEWLLLSAKSPLRRLLDAAAERDGQEPEAFGFLPTLEFFQSRSGLRSSFVAGGEVESLVLEPLTRVFKSNRRELANVVGRSLALWSWLGVSDLHWENLALGLNERGKIVFGPLDVEMILADLSLPTETKLLPDADAEYAVICQHAAGVRRALPYLGKPVDVADLLAMAGAYKTTLRFLDRHAGAIAKVFASLPGLREAPIRVCLRGTEEYVRAATEPLWPPLLDAETEQLERGDIPYFFRLYGRAGIHYYENRALTKRGRLPLRGDVPQLEALLPVTRGLRSPSRRRLSEDGLITLLGAFDHPAFEGRHRADELDVTFGARSLLVKLRGGEQLRSGRDLSAFVSSVYLPCRCGEVRSVFVPAVTKCRTSAASV
jgi:hypothetical protein